MYSRPFLARAFVAASKKPAAAATAVRALSLTTAAPAASSSSATSSSSWLLFGAATAAAAAAVTAASSTINSNIAMCDGKIPTGGDVISTGTPTKEPKTGILFPQLCNGYYLVGCGVRVKYAFVKVYAVGTYVDFLSMSAVKHRPDAEIEQALLDPNYPRTLRIVMNRSLSIDKYTAAIVEALEPRMKGQDLEKLEEFKKLNPPVDLVQGAEIEMTIRGDTLLYKNAVGGVGTVRSAVFTKAMCDVYYGSDPVSPSHKEAVLEGIKKL